MRKLKKALSLTLALALSLTLAVPAFAADSDFTIENGVLTKYNGPGGDVVIPSGVTKIGQVSFGNKQNITSVVIPEGVTEIGTHAFVMCSNLTSVAIPVSVTVINVFPFADTGLTDVYYAGTEAQWQAITSLDYMPKSAAVHFNSAGPGQSTTPSQPEQPGTPDITVEDIPSSGTAVANTQMVTVDGKKVEFQTYALIDANGNAANYIKLRDMAYILNGTKAQFNVGYSNETGITATSGQPYQANGSEMNTPFSGDRGYTGGGQSVQINGKAVEMTAISLLDDNGGGYTYFKIRDLGKALGFNVGYSAEKGVYIESDKLYVG